MPFKIIRNDITKVKADAIVNTANPEPVIGSGTDLAVYTAAGMKELLEARKKIGLIKPGEVSCTPAFALRAKYIIHTVGPSWEGGNHGERDILRACYGNSLELAHTLKCKSIAFPLIATGNYGFPKDEALDIALSEIGKFLLTHDMRVILVVFDQSAFVLSEKLVGEIDQYIDEHAARRLHLQEYIELGMDRDSFRRIVFRRELEAKRRKTHFHRVDRDESGAEMILQNVHAGGQSLEEFMKNQGDSFRKRLFDLIDLKGMTDVETYKKAGVDRKVFSSIKCKQDYHPNKKTSVAFAIALELDLAEAQDLLARAGYTLSDSDPFDLIIRYFIEKGDYDMYRIDSALFEYGQKMLIS